MSKTDTNLLEGQDETSEAVPDEEPPARRELTDADKQRLLPGVITLSLINKELEEVEATLRESHGALPLLKRTGPAVALELVALELVLVALELVLVLQF